MPSIYRPRRPRASPLWQIVHHAWDDFLAQYESTHRKTHGPLRPDAVAVVDQFYRCGDLAAGFTPNQAADWRPQAVGACLRPPAYSLRPPVCSAGDWMRVRLGLPDGRLAAIASVQTFGDYLGFHPHLHILAATGLVDSANRFHLLPIESLEPLAELFRHRFLETLLREKLVSAKKARQLLNWTHSGFSLDAGEMPVASHDVDGRRRLAEYLLRAPFSLEKITWNETTRTVLYRSKRNWRTKRNFEVFSATDFLAAAVEHIPPKNQQTIRYYGLYSNKRRGMDAKAGRPQPKLVPSGAPLPPPSGEPTLFVLPPPDPKSGRALRPLWRELIIQIWGQDPLLCPCCKGTMRVVETMIRSEEVEFFLRLHGLWEGVIGLPPPPDPPYDIETMEPIHAPPHLGWGDEGGEGQPRDEWPEDQPAWQAPELPLDDGRVLVLDGDPLPEDWD